MNPSSSTDPYTQRLLDRVARGLRFWSLAEGFALTLAILAVVIAISLAIDYLADVWFDASFATRVAISTVWAILLLAALVHFIVRRCLGRPSPTALALLIEKKQPELQDRLLTSVELARRSHPFSKALLEATAHDAKNTLEGFRVATLFNRSHVARVALFACTLTTAVAIASATFPAVASAWINRVILLQADQYPRRSKLAFQNLDHPVQKVPRGRNFEILVEADADAVVPQRVVLRLTMPASGSNVRLPMTKVGRNRFKHVLRTVLEPVELYATGGDARTPNVRLETVEPPAIQSVRVDVEPPKYTGRSPDQRTPAGAPIQVPAHSNVGILIAANKPIRSLQAQSPGQTLNAQRVATDKFQLDFPVDRDMPVQISLVDQDDIDLDEPFPIDFVAVPDQPPTVQASATGVSTAITRLATIPIDIQLSDDYGIQSAELEITAQDATPQRNPLALPAPNPTSVENRISFDVTPLGMEPGNRLTLAVLATDIDNIDGPHTTSSEALQFEIVTTEELLARLTSRELDLRQRFEQIVLELRESSDALEIVQKLLDDPSKEAATARRLNLEQTLTTIRKDASESSSIHLQFQDIVEQLLNNRIGNTTLLDRLQTGVIQPLGDLVEIQFPTLVASVEALPHLSRASDIEPALTTAQDELDRTLNDCQAILLAMRKLESFNELVTMLRGIIDEQEQINDELRKVRKEKILDLLKD